MTTYHINNDYSRYFRRIDNTRKEGIMSLMRNPNYGRANVVSVITDDKNRFVGEIRKSTNGFEWVRHYYKTNNSTGRRVMLDKVWVLNRDGSLGKRKEW